jgi:hypothetical protein
MVVIVAVCDNLSQAGDIFYVDGTSNLGIMQYSYIYYFNLFKADFLSDKVCLKYPNFVQLN